MKITWMTSIILLWFLPSIGQDTARLFFIGNLEELNNPPPINKKEASSYLIGLGDYGVDVRDLEEDNRHFHLQFIKDWSERVKSTYLISGDGEWAENGKNGLSKLQDLDDVLKDSYDIKRGLLLDSGCPGPEKIDINDEYVLLFINSQWFIHPHEKPISTDNDCDLFNEEDFWEELEDEIEDESDKRIILVAHHTVLSSGRYAGKVFYPERWKIPLLGQFIADYKKNVGRPKDFSYPPYQAYRDKIRDLMADYQNLIYVSGHEKNNEIIEENGNFYINAGALSVNHGASGLPESVFYSEKPGLVQLILTGDKNVEVHIESQNGTSNSVILPYIQENTSNNLLQEVQDSGRYVAGPEYRASGFKKFWMGNHYREEWTTPISAPKLWLDSLFGGLTPYAKGGGLQTSSLKLKDNLGRKFAFRSINKNPEKALGRQVRKTIYRHLVKDLITTQHPYGGLVAAELMNHTDILHVNPTLYFLPDQESLGEYRSEFAGTLGTLELRPDNYKGGSFGGADEILSTHQMYRRLINEDDHVVDKVAYAKARVFDMWLGDWDRHQDNWKWAAYKKKKGVIYRPIPRDRDHVFSSWEGIIPTVADWVIPNAESFEKNFGNVLHLNWKARHLDRFIGNELTLEDWKYAARYLQETLDSNSIRKALEALPEEVAPLSSQEIYEKLLSRLAELPAAVEKSYGLLAREVNIVGSNKKDLFEVSSDDNQGVIVRIYDGETITYQRRFDPAETRAVYLYGLGKKDNIVLNGRYPSPIKIKIIGGKGDDIIEDKTPAVPKRVKIYDYYRQDYVVGNQLEVKKDHAEPIFKVNEFEYPAFFPFLGLKSSSGNGTGIQATFSYKKKIFNKPDFGRETNFQAIYYPRWNAYLLDLNHKYKYFWLNQDLRVSAVYSSYYSGYPFFYGIGNETQRDDELYEDGYYRLDYNTLKSNFGFSKNFLRTSSIHYYGIFEYNNVADEDDDDPSFLKDTDQEFSGLGRVINYGIGVDLTLDMRNNALFTRHGSYFKASMQGLAGGESFFSKMHFHLAKYSTYQVFSPTTFVFATGIYHTVGDAPFYQQAALGSNTNLRGHFRNRYVDRSAFYYNTELRVHLGTFQTFLAPIRFGVFGMHDSGKVFDGSFSLRGKFHPTYGGGLYFAPLSDAYSFVLTLANSEDRQTYFRMEFGWVL